MAGTSSSRWGRLGLLCCVLAALALYAAADRVAPARAVSCPPIPGTLSPASLDPATHFTMLIRIQNQVNVNAYVDPNDLGRRIRPQDIFVINTRFQNNAGTSSPSTQAPLVSQLRAAFPCNRIIALNGQGSDPSQPGYAYALADQGLYALMVDWESADWADAQATGTPLPPFTYDFGQTLPRMSAWASATSGALGANPVSASTRVGMVPIEQGPYWNYGQIAQTMDIFNRRLGGTHDGVQSVMTQGSCAAGAPAFGARMKPLFDQWRFRIKYIKRKKRRHHKIVKVRVPRRVKIKRQNRADLNNAAVQISFTTNPTPGDPLPIISTGPQTADQCVAAGLARGAGAFFFYASEDSMRLLFGQPTVGSLRPPA